VCAVDFSLSVTARVRDPLSQVASIAVSLPLTRIKALVVSSTYIVGQSEGTAMSSRFDEAERLRERARLLRESASKVSLVTDKEGCLRWPRAMN